MSLKRRSSLQPLETGPGGRYRCRWCGKEVQPPKRTFCSPECIHQHTLRASPSYLRHYVEQRDHGVCARCSIDVVALERAFRDAWHWGRENVTVEQAYEVASIPEAFRKLDHNTSWWAADHIVPVSEGGGCCGLEGMRTLCLPCHHVVTRQLARRAKARRRHLTMCGK